MLMVVLPQVSLAVGASKVQALVHSTVLSPAQVMLGGVVSTTVTFWLQVALLLPQDWEGVVEGKGVDVVGRRTVKKKTVLTMLMGGLPQVSLAVGGSKVQALGDLTGLVGRG